MIHSSSWLPAGYNHLVRGRTGTAQLPLHTGKAPAWLFTRMVTLAREVSIHIVTEFGPVEMLRRLSDPFWFQAFGCLLGFDWHSSGVTTTVTGAVKEGLKGLERDLGLYAGGGKGAASRRTPDEITLACDRLSIDPARFSFAPGGKDGFPFPVDRDTYDHTVEVLRAAVTRAGIDRSERVEALKRLVRFGEERVRASLAAEPSLAPAGEKD